MVSISVMRKNHDELVQENEELIRQIQQKKERGEHWKMLSELFQDEIKKAKERYGCL